MFTLFSFVNANHGEHFRICGPLLCFGLKEGGWVIYPFLVLVPSITHLCDLHLLSFSSLSNSMGVKDGELAGFCHVASCNYR